MKKDDIYYQAVLTRDARFDGKFFIGVKTTGIYCRPVCPAKPARKNVEFFSHALEAENAGYRPCMRCRPESAPRSSVWMGTSAMVKRAVRLIQNENSLHFNEDKFADLFGVSARHLRRVFVDEIGKTPKQLAFEVRLDLARQLITETTLSMTEIAFASGFRSIRRFNSSFKERFHKSPSDLRRHKKTEDEGIVLYLSYRPPFDFRSLLGFYKTHQVGDLEIISDDKMIRYFLYEKTPGKVEITQDEVKNKLKLKIECADKGCLYYILSRVRNLFDTDSDPVLLANVLEKDSVLKKLLKKTPGIRLPTGWDPFEISIGAILGQLVSVEQGGKLLAQLIQLCGVSKTFQGQTLTFFPTPSDIVKADLTTLGTTQKRKEALKEFCRALVRGDFTLESTQDIQEFEKRVLKVKGIGPWTAQYISLKALAHPDAFPATDLILARSLRLHPDMDLENLRPWRGYAAVLLWKEYWPTKK